MGNMNLFELGSEQISTSSLDTVISGGLKHIHLNSNHGWKPSSDSSNEFLMVRSSYTFQNNQLIFRLISLTKDS